MEVTSRTGQLAAFRVDVDKMVKGRWWRRMTVPFHPGFLGIGLYRLERAAYLRLGERWRVVHALLSPVWLLIRPFAGSLEIHYLAEVGPGLRILHPSLGVVISGRSTLGRDVILTGGNCIGGRPGTEHGAIVVGDGVTLGANAVVLGPVIVGDRVQVAAGAVVVRDVPAGATVVGVPARPVGAEAGRSDAVPG